MTSIRDIINFIENVEESTQECVDSEIIEITEENLTEDIRVILDTLHKSFPAKGKYDLNVAFKNVDSLLSDLPDYLRKYTSTVKNKDHKDLVNSFRGIKPNKKLEDKEKYLRDGFESKGYTADGMALVWTKEAKESLHIFAQSNQLVAEIRDFFRYFKIIK